MQKPPFRKRELNENVLIGLAFHKRQIWLHANVIVPFFSLHLSMLRDQNEVGADFERRQSVRFVPTRVKKEGFPFFSLEDRCAYFSKHLPVFWFGLFFPLCVCVCVCHHECLFKPFQKKLAWVAHRLNHRPTYSLALLLVKCAERRCSSNDNPILCAVAFIHLILRRKKTAN